MKLYEENIYHVYICLTLVVTPKTRYNFLQNSACM